MNKNVGRLFTSSVSDTFYVSALFDIFISSGIDSLTDIMNKLDKGSDLCKVIREGIIDEREPVIIQADNLLRKNQQSRNVMEKSLEYAETALEFYITHLLTDHKLLAKAYVDVAHILSNRNADLNRASQYYGYALKSI
jgi:hypothetical protein